MTEPLWLDLADVLDIHRGQLASFGGAEGVRDEDLVESALARPQNMFLYENVEDVLILATRLGVGLAKNHGFVDGNKRTGAVEGGERWRRREINPSCGHRRSERLGRRD